MDNALVSGGPAWQRSSRCATSTCVEVAAVDDQILIRDSKNPDADALQVSRADFAGFLAAVRAGDFDEGQAFT
ncbi:hypothetical protein ACWT_6154 [Actinoplanes sp. SE50]|uniref:DUF397 domain-containing protein n=1 Tax=unclassified Actinoplanes TaxID=2626549 RepID=UPI00023ECD5F|nr:MULTISPECIES: DUF397 domain-containing protein [unclassified Actinoplanes]AEV87168.1 hypothetical protein ACPL_6286 [Actinoplanes sp. SE50/110]ATO85569.1 hypothetical protein ACWT_6154 [Actinoplanes sp. SE50]SLM02982.1 hypothetical protein ACSP50_6267 [Actinoplanes sp. SE50/110]